MSKELDKELQEELNEAAAVEKEEAVGAEGNTNVEETVNTEEAVETEEAKEAEEISDREENSEKAAEYDTETEEDKKPKKKLFGNKKDKKDEMIEELTDKHQRLMAEFQNFRNRSEKEKSAMFEVGAKSIVEKILPVVDNFERGLATLSEDDLNSPVGQGMSMIYKQFTTALEEMGVEVIEAVGCEFNPEFHNAVMHIEDEELGENMIAEEFQKGYTYRGSVIRYSMVKVAN